MGKRPSSSKATRGASKGKKLSSSSSSNPKTNKYRSQYNSLAVIAKGGPSKKIQNKDAIKKVAKDAVERKQLLDDMDKMTMTSEGEAPQGTGTKSKKSGRTNKNNCDKNSIISGGSKLTTASFASVWSNCTNTSLNEFFQVWNPNLETHKDALAVIAGLSQMMSAKGTDQTDLEYAKTLFKILDSSDTPRNVLTGTLLALSFVLRKLQIKLINENFDSFYTVLKNIMEKYFGTRKKSLIKCLVRCFASLSKAHPRGKEAIEKSLRKKINLSIRQFKVQDKIKL